MKERPIIFSAPMVRAILEGRKTQTRRVVSERHIHQIGTSKLPVVAGWSKPMPYGQPGDRLWVRETFARIGGQTQPWIATDYRATYKDGDRLGIKKRWTPAIHMPRCASRILLEITAVRVERLQEMAGQAPYPGESDALAEGVNRIDHGRGDFYFSAFRNDPHPKNWGDPADAFRELWESINGPGSWDKNPLVWVVEFKRVEQSA